MAFEMYKTHKLANHLESEAYEHCQWAIQSFYDLTLGENEYGYEQDVYEVLNKGQIEEIEDYINENSQENMWHEPYALMSLNVIVNNWYEHHGEDNT